MLRCMVGEWTYITAVLRTVADDLTAANEGSASRACRTS
jgi:hypothetical protein